MKDYWRYTACDARQVCSPGCVTPSPLPPPPVQPAWRGGGGDVECFPARPTQHSLVHAHAITAPNCQNFNCKSVKIDRGKKVTMTDGVRKSQA